MDAVALASVVTSGLVGIGGLALTARNAGRERASRRDERDADAQRELVRRGAEAVAPFLTVLSTIEPDRIAFNARPESHEEIDQARRRFQELRDPLAAFALSHPSPTVLELAGRFDIAVDNAIIQTGWLLRDVLEHRDLEEQRGVALRKHDEARRLAGKLHEAIIEP
jgi:hypothetical protein